MAHAKKTRRESLGGAANCTAILVHRRGAHYVMSPASLAARFPQLVVSGIESSDCHAVQWLKMRDDPIFTLGSSITKVVDQRYPCPKLTVTAWALG